MDITKTCKNCLHWGKKMGNDCGRIDVSPGRNRTSADVARIAVWDSGVVPGRALTATLRTDPGFGCNLFAASDAATAEESRAEAKQRLTEEIEALRTEETYNSDALAARHRQYMEIVNEEIAEADVALSQVKAEKHLD